MVDRSGTGNLGRDALSACAYSAFIPSDQPDECFHFLGDRILRHDDPLDNFRHNQMITLQSILFRAFCLTVAFLAGILAGSRWTGAKWETKFYKAESDAAETLQKATTRAMEAERQLSEGNTALVEKYAHEAANAKYETNRLRKSVNDGTLRLFVGTVENSGNPLSSTPGVKLGAGRARLDNETAQFLIDIAETGDDYGRRLNQCIDQYNTARMTINRYQQ